MEKTNHGKVKPILLIIGLVVFLTFLILPLQNVSAIGLINPFSGKVVSAIIPGVTCPGGIGPIIIIPSSFLFPIGPYAITPATKRYLNVTIFPLLPADWIIGLYSPIMVPACWTTSWPPLPVTVYPIIIVGSSKKF